MFLFGGMWTLQQTTFSCLMEHISRSIEYSNAEDDFNCRDLVSEKNIYMWPSDYSRDILAKHVAGFCSLS